MKDRRQWRWWIVLVVMTVGASCGDDGATGPSGETSFEPYEPEALVQADESSFDVQWSAGTIVAEESDVLADIEDLQPDEKVFRVASGSPILQGVEEGSTVVWPHVGFFEVQRLTDQGEFVEVEVAWANFADAVETANISFEHEMRAGEPGRVLGVVTGPPPANPAGLTLEAGPIEITDGGVSYSSGGVSAELKVTDTTAELKFGAENDSLTAGMQAKVTGLRARGTIRKASAEDEPEVEIVFSNVAINGEVSLGLKGAGGGDEVIPAAQLVFPMMVGPVPVYVALSIRVGVVSSIQSADTVMSTKAGFNLAGSVTLRRAAGGGFESEGMISDYSTQSPSIDFDTAITAGIRVDVDAPRISFGLGRPGIATASVFGTKSLELGANVTLDPREPGEFCAEVFSNGAITAGGGISAFGWSVEQARQVSVQPGASEERGELCE